jgi:hypothetical protein
MHYSDNTREDIAFTAVEQDHDTALLVTRNINRLAFLHLRQLDRQHNSQQQYRCNYRCDEAELQGLSISVTN